MKNYTIEKFLTSIGLVLLCFFAISNKLYASHAMGVDLTYQSQGNNSFLVRLKFFRDCNGIVPGATVPINIRSATKGSSQNLTLSQVGGAVDITPVCPSSQTRCENASSAYPFGVQQYVYEGTVTLPPAIDYILSFSLCCRNSSVTTLVNPGGQNIYVETLLNSIDAPTNNSPQFVNYPVPFFCVNQPTKYTHGVVESDGDILEFSLVNAKQGQGADVTYANGYSGIAPVTTSGGMSINSTTGELVFTPTAIQSGVISIRVKEYRMISGFKTLIGEVVRDMQFAIIDCVAFGGGMNTIPVVSGVNGTATSEGVTGDYSITARAGTSLCFNMAAYDAQSSVLSMTWNLGISGGTFSVNSAGTLATFCWLPTINDVGLHFFSVDVKDGNCPIKGINTYTFTVNIVECPTLNTAPPNVTIVNSTCGAGCVIGGGSISAPTGSPCPEGAVLEYQVNGGAWTTTLPTYNQTGPAQSIKTRCSCSSNPATVSPESNAVLTVPVTAPSLTVPANGTSTVACLAQAVAPTLPVVNNCVGEPITPTGPVITDTPNPLSCEGKRTYTYTYTCGSSSATWSYEYTVERESFTLPANGMSTVNSPSLAIAPSLPTVLSNCGETLTPTGPVITNSPNPVNCEGTRTYSYTYTDCEGNTAVWSYEYTIIDNEAPTITCPANITVNNTTGQCGAVVTFSAPVGTDNCAGAITTQTAGLASGAQFPVGITTNTFQVKASNGQTATCSFTVTVVDAEAPTITCPANITVNNTTGQCGAVVTFSAPVGIDNCAGAITTQTAGLASGAQFPVGITTNTFEVKAANGQTATCSFTVTVVDAEAPTITCPANITVNNTAGQCGAVVTFSAPVGTDNCAGAITTQTAGLASGSQFPVGITTNTFQVKASNGQTTTCSFTVTVVDAEAPTITCPANITVNNTAGQCGAVVTFSAPVGTDNCTGAITTQTAGLASGAQFPVGVTTNTFQVKASNGQTATCSFTVTVVDAEAPTITCPANITVNNSAGQCGAVVTFSAPVGTDNCAGAITTQTAGLASGSQFPVGITTNTFQVKASNGQTATCSFTVTVVDAEAPTITCPSNITVCETAVVTYIPPIGSDNCLGSSTLQIAGLASGVQFPAGITTNTFEVKASNGQTSTCSFTVTVTPRVEAMISGATTVCQNSSSPVVVFTGSNGLAPYTFNYKINGGATQMVKTTSGNSVTVPVPTNVAGTFTYTLVSVVESSSISCSQNQNSSVEVKVQGKPTIALTTFQQMLNEGNSQTFCDIDANPVNVLQFGVTTGCVVGTPVWRVQVGGGVWSEWSSNPPTTQLSNNQPHRYQAACDANCPVTYTSPIEVKINYRASTPQQVSLVADGVTVNEGESKEVCNVEGSLITFNATCATGEVILYSVDGGNYSSVLPTQLIDGQFHNYRVRCRKSDGTDSCIESESGTMQLKITNGLGLGQVPVANLNVTSGCGTPVSFSGTASCGSLATVWYNASTNVALPTLPSQTPTETTSYYARCQAGGGCLSEKSNAVTFTVIPVSVAPVVTVSAEVVCTGQEVTISTTCPAGATPFWNTGVQTSSFKVSFTNVTKQSYWVRCNHSNGCQSAESLKKDVYWNAFVVTLINVGESKSAVKTNDRNAWSSQFITQDGGPELAASTQINPTLYYVENPNKLAPRYWTINVDACALGTNGSLTFDLLATPETGVPQSFNTHENNAPYFMYANREGWTELYAQNHPAYGFYQDNGVGGNVYDRGLPKGLYKLGVRYWDQKGWGSIYPSTRKAQGNVLAYQEYWFRIQSKSGVGEGAARFADVRDLKSTDNGFAEVAPNPVTDRLRVNVASSKGQAVTMTLLDVWGREVLQRKFLAESNAHLEEVATGHLSNGSYLLKVSTEQNHATLKVVKMK